MARTQVGDAIVTPQDPGTGLSSVNDPTSAGLFSLMSGYKGNYVLRDWGEGMGFVNRSTSNDTITIGTGVCYIKDTSNSTSNERGSGGNISVQSRDDGANPPTYDTEMPDNSWYMVVFPSQQQISVSGSQLNQIWVSVDVDGNNNTVELASDGGGGTTSIPSDTFIKIGEANPDDASADIRSRDRTLKPIVTETTVTLSSGSAIVATGVTETPAWFDIYLDPSGDGANSADVKVAGRAFWDNSDGEYKIEIVEDGTSVGNPDVGVQVTRF